MKQLTLTLLLSLLLIAGAKAQVIETLTPSQAAAYTGEELINVTNLTLVNNTDNTGWNTDAFTGLAKALHPIGVNNKNENLQIVEAADIVVADNTELSELFKSCTALTQVNIAGINGANINSIFAGCTALTRVNSQTDGVCNMENFTNISQMIAAFSFCQSLTNIRLSSTQGSLGLSFTGTFNHCTNLTCVNSTIDGHADLSAFTCVNSLTGVFNNCNKLTTITLPAYQSGAVDIYGAFNLCNSLQTINGLETYTQIADMAYTFHQCYSLREVRINSNIPTLPEKAEYTFYQANPNLLIYLSDSNIPDNNGWKERNYIVDGIAICDINLYDGHPFHCSASFELNEHTITFAPNFTTFANHTNGWNTLIIPFEGELYADNEAGGQYWLKAYTGNSSDQETLYFATPQHGVGLQANIPYLIALPGEAFGSANMQGKTITIKATGITVPATPQNLVTTQGNYSYTGTYSEIQRTDIHTLRQGITDDSTPDVFACATAAESQTWTPGKVSPFRAYIQTVDGQPAPSCILSIKDEDDGSGIATTDKDSSLTKTKQPYKVMTKQGLRIVKGEKVFTVDGCSTTQVD